MVAKPALQRLPDGKTQGLLFLRLGSVNAAFLSKESGRASAPTLRFSVQE